jgi:hypothetical protein
MRVYVRIAFFCFVALSAAAAKGDVIATYGERAQRVVLTTDDCPGHQGSDELMRAYQPSQHPAVQGCWFINQRGNPVVSWDGGGIQELPSSVLRLAPAYAALLRDADPTPPPPASAAPRDAAHARPPWCQARTLQPHERTICEDPGLSAADLELAPLWRAYRQTLQLTPIKQAQEKSGFFHRLKACGTDAGCLAAEQARQSAFYRHALAASRGASPAASQQQGR